MKNLLIAFDFSKNALKTLEYALRVANKTQANLHLVWVDSSSTPDNVLNIDQELRIETRKLLDEIIPSFEARLHNKHINTLLRKGKVYQEVANAARLIEADIVFAGTHGVSGYEQFWIGSNAYRIVTGSPCPVLTVRGDYEIGPEVISRIVLPLDSTPETRQKLPVAANIAALFGAEVLPLLIYNSPLNSIRKRMRSYGDEAVKCLNERNIPNRLTEVEADQMVSTILDFARSEQADLITIMTEQSGTSGSMFLGPYAQQIINYSVIPVLSIQSKSV
ncbi:MAG: universal stress protein [Bacteroidetes bacterium]|nr:universal stress protein [Bacteroidota bacterium]